LQKERQQKLGVDKLRPWDLAVDPDHNPALHPFTESSDLVDKCHKIFSELDPRFAEYYHVLRAQQLVDLDNRKGKAPGGYQSTLSEARVPFIFMNAVGVHRDVETMLHEAGHAFHALAARNLPLHAYRSAPIEFCEVASMGMELLAAPHLRAFYSDTDTKRAQRDHLEGIIKFFPWMATVDAFQHWIYTHPGHTREERTAFFISLMDRFGGTEDWTGFEQARACMWHRQLHIFEIPFYYVEYGIAQLGALQLWQAPRSPRRARQIPRRPGPRRLASTPRTLRRQRSCLRFHRPNHRPPHAQRERRAGRVGGVTSPLKCHKAKFDWQSPQGGFRIYIYVIEQDGEKSVSL
jgi:oligoendopeptidase F